MKYTAIHQLLAGYSDNDAISHEALILQNLLRKLGYESNIYAETRQQNLDSTPCPTLDELPTPQNDHLYILHYAGASKATDTFINLPGTKVMVYHNITPGHYFAPFDTPLSKELDQARTSLKTVGQTADAIWAVSEFNATECRELGLKNIEVFPLLFDPKLFDHPQHEGTFNALQEGPTNILFVGRLVPNKNIEELMLAFTQYHLRINPNSQLNLIGSEWSCPRYFAMLRMLACELSTHNILFRRFVNEEQLQAYYATADLFISTSNHEGYCLPLIEAMYKHVPVIAKNKGGMSEALNKAGCLYDNLNPRELAELMHATISDSTTRDQILSSQHLRLKELENRNPTTELTLLLETLKKTST